jgi:branched-chain amino acid transport system ATP-binding protein
MFALECVTAGYGESVVLRDVSLSVPESSVVALLGPNGAGKTTVMRVASGTLRQRQGRVVIDGVDVSAEDPYRRAARGVCHVPEGRAVFPGLSVRENLVLFTTRDRDAAIDRAVEAFPILGQRLSQRAGTLSGGEQQMLALARAYMADPRIILLDEVSMGLAPKVVEDIFAAIARLAASGVSLLLVEQYVTKALDLADTVYVLNKGCIVHASRTAEVDEDELFARYLGSRR